MRVLVTRPQRDAQATAARLAQAGHEALVAPVMRIMATGVEAPIGDYDGVIATSVHALDAIIDDKSFARLFDKPLHSVGTRSVEMARQARIFSDGINGTDAKALALALLRSQARGVRLLYLAGRDRKPDLELALSAGGLKLETVVVYEARAVESLPDAAANALRSGTVDAVLHYSRRSASISVDLAADAGLAPAFAVLRHVCISADCAQGLAVADARVAPEPNEAAMIALLT